MHTVVEHNVASGEITYRDYTSEETAYLTDLAAREAVRVEERKAEEQTKEVVMQDAIADAKSLGFTDAMIAVMYPSLQKPSL